MQSGLVGIFRLLGHFYRWTTVKWQILKIHKLKLRIRIFAKQISTFLKILDGSSLISIALEAVKLCGKSVENAKNEDCQK